MRWGPGPVFIYECLANSRRWQTYALRSAGVAALLCAMAMIASSRETTAESWRDYASLGEGYFIALIGVELAIVLLAAPAATAGAICLDRARGTLAHMLMTDLSDSEIVLGKLAARLLPVLGLVACTWPVMAICSLLGGIDPIALTLAFAIIVAIAVLGCSIALAISVWARKSHEVILVTYTVFILCGLFWPIWYMLAFAGWAGPVPDWALLANPFYVAFAPYADPGKLQLWDYSVFFAVTLGASVVSTVIAVWRMRPVACRGAAEKNRGPWIGWMGRVSRWLPGPSLDRNPVLWREWHRSRPSRWMTAIVVLLMGTTFVLCVGGAVAFWINGVNIGPRAVWPIVGICSYMFHMIFGLLMIAAIAPTSMAEERQRGSLDLLATTTLSSRAIVVGKWLGTFRLVWPITIGPGLLALAMATARSQHFAFGRGMPPDYYRQFTFGARCYGAVLVVVTIVAHGALITSVGLALAVWVKRQSRAIALSVGWFILVTAVCPIVISMMMSGGPSPRETGFALSPVGTCGFLVTLLTQRTYAFSNGVLWRGTLWAAEVFIAAMGLLWLTVWTFDACFDRIPDRPRSISARTLEILILTAMIDLGCLVPAFDCWIVGVDPPSNGAPFWRTLAFSLLIAIGLLLIGATAAWRGRPMGLQLSDGSASVAVRRFVLGKWLRSFCLVLLLAIGPVLLALALATAQRTRHYEPQFTKNAAGVNVFTSYVLARNDLPYNGEVRLGQRLLLTAILFTTILAHGGTAVSAGLALATVSDWSRRKIAGVVAVAVLAALALPFVFFVLNGRRPLDAMGGSFAMAMSSILAAIVTRTSFNLDELILSVAAWDIATVLFALGLSWWTVRFWQRRFIGESRAKPAPVADLGDTCPTAKASFVGE
jgi:ABC-type transport system involved in multi-copper enzyme maturation permease subunit